LNNNLFQPARISGRMSGIVRQGIVGPAIVNPSAFQSPAMLLWLDDDLALDDGDSSCDDNC